MAAPTDDELLHHVDEVGWSIVSMCKHLLLSRTADIEGRVDWAQAAFDGAVLHMRAIVEFLGERGAHICATHYCLNWDGQLAARRRDFDLANLYQELNIHAAHLSRLRYRRQPESPWDLAAKVETLLHVYGDLIDCPDVACRQELVDHLTEARLHLARFKALQPL